MHNCLIQQLKIKLTVLMWNYDRLFQIIERIAAVPTLNS
jgi:hypothetical protein